MTSLVTKGLPSRSPPIHEPNWKNGVEREVFARIKLREHAVELLQKIGDAIEQRLVKEMQAPGDFLIDRWFLQAQFAGHPQQARSRRATVSMMPRAFARGPSRLFQLDQQPVDAAMLFEDGHPLRFGGMRGDDRPDPRRSQPVAQLLRIDAEICRLGDEIGECALHRRFAAHALGLAAQPHRGMLFDDGKQLEPDSVRLEDTGEQIRREIPSPGFPPQCRRDLWMLAVHDAGQQLEQYVRGFLAVERRLNASRRVAGLESRPARPKLRHRQPRGGWTKGRRFCPTC